MPLQLSWKLRLRLSPLHHKFLYVSSQHYSSAKLKWDSQALIKHITPASFSQAEYIFISVNHENYHWILLAGSRSKKNWHILDSWQDESHKKNLRSIIRCLGDDFKKNQISVDITKWRLSAPQGRVPQQINGFDCGMFVCKFMDRLLLSKKHALKWDDHDNWQELMPTFRRTFAVNLCRKAAANITVVAQIAAKEAEEEQAKAVAQAEEEARAIEEQVRLIDKAVAEAEEAKAKANEQANAGANEEGNC